MAYRARRQSRYYTLIQHHFLRFEAQELSSVTLQEAPYLRAMIKERDKMWRPFIQQAKANGWSPTRIEDEWRLVVKNEYVDNLWVRERQAADVGRTAYKASPWEMIREYRQRAIESGEYFPAPRNKGKGKHKTPTTLGDIRKARSSRQRSNERARQRRAANPDELARWREQRRQQRIRAKQRRRG